MAKMKCPECAAKFPWDFALGWPKACPLCGFNVHHGRDDDDIVMPFVRTVRSPIVQAVDGMYRDMEASSEKRTHLAAEQAGCSPEDMSSLKITNLNDRRDAEIAAMPVQNAVTDFMAANPQAAGFRGADGIGYSSAVASGPAPNSGARMQQALRQAHSEASHGTAVSDMPALETQNPLYRRRV